MAIDCSSCSDLKTKAPSFVANGVTTAICTSLKNNTGLNPSNSSTNCDDLKDANDCLVGRMAQEVEAYEVCDWKDFMKKFVTNAYTVNDAQNCWLCGLQEGLDSIDNMCDSIDNIFDLISGNKPASHLGEFLPSFLAKIQGTWIPDSPESASPEFWKPNFRAEIRSGAGCDASKRLGMWFPDATYTKSNYPHIWTWRATQDLVQGEVMGVVQKSAVVPNGMPEDRWNNMLRSGAMTEWGVLNGDTILKITTRGYVVIDGVAFNSDLAQYGEGNVVFTMGPFIGPSRTGWFAGDITPSIRSYEY